MKITFIFHSSYAVELTETVLIFDYYGEGRLPKIPEGKKVFFLNSHAHPDHFNRKILALKEKYPQAEYILSGDIRLRPKEKEAWVHSVKPRESCRFGSLAVQTLRSTDAGVAFAVETEGKRIYHGGDLNWWHWEGEGKAYNNNRAANFRREIDRIEGQRFDLAFVPLDPRLESAYDWGMKYFLQKTRTELIFPMHFWEQYEVCGRVLKEDWMQEYAGAFRKPEYAGQEWELPTQNFGRLRKNSAVKCRASAITSA